MHTTEQLNTALAGRYLIEREIGAGGMATVYLARDVKHNRQVALKVLNPELGVVLGSERFMAEIEVTANLHHPNLLPLFDSGEAGGLLFYVMPYVEGETLRARLQRERQLSVDEAVRIAVAIASALDYAHRHHIIHRDLKPENILMHEGQPLVMDFGIALAVSRAGGARITQTGLSLGTPQYMSPEQATGDHALDGRTDIYSLGAVLYEMLVGDPPHTGSTVQAVIAKVITEHPSSVRATRPSVPEHVEAALFKALAKLPADRFTTAADFAAALEGTRPVTHTMGSAGTAARTAGSRTVRIRAREVAAWTLAVAGVAGAVWLATSRKDPAPARLAVALPENLAIDRSLSGLNIALSRDGSLLAFGAIDGRTRGLYVRRMDNATIRRVIPEVAGFPVFSPDGRWLAYADDRLLIKKVPVDGGASQTLSDSASSPTWTDAGDIVFARGRGRLWIVDDNGGAPRLLATPDSTRGYLRYGLPDALPGGRAALINIGTGAVDQLKIGLVSLPDGKVTDLGLTGSAPRYSEPGFIVFHRGDGIIMAVPFSARRKKVTGPAIRLAENVLMTSGTMADFAVSRNGALAFRSREGRGLSPTQLTFVDHAGKARLVRHDERVFSQPRISPDGRRVALRIGGERFNTGDIWVLELSIGALTRVTSDNASFRPTWSRDGTRVFYMNGNNINDTRIMSRPWDGSGRDSMLLSGTGLAEFSEGIRGGWSALRTLGGRDIFLLPTDSVGSARRQPLVVSPANETDIALSPDGHWLAYSSDETGRVEVYVRPVPGPGPRIAVSVDGGTQPLWSRDGGRLYYRGAGWMRSASIVQRPEFAVTRRESLFVDTYLADAEGINYAVTPDSRGFLMLSGTSQPNPTRLEVMLNWPSLVARTRATELR